MLGSVLVGSMLGGLSSGLVAAFFTATRTRRMTGKLPIILFGYLVVASLLTGPMIVLVYFPQYIGIQDSYSLFGYAFSMVCGVVLTIRAEMRWRKAVGLQR
jgi:hypothetical protein